MQTSRGKCGDVVSEKNKACLGGGMEKLEDRNVKGWKIFWFSLVCLVGEWKSGGWKTIFFDWEKKKKNEKTENDICINLLSYFYYLKKKKGIHLKGNEEKEINLKRLEG